MLLSPILTCIIIPSQDATTPTETCSRIYIYKKIENTSELGSLFLAKNGSYFELLYLTWRGGTTLSWSQVLNYFIIECLDCMEICRDASSVVYIFHVKWHWIHVKGQLFFNLVYAYKPLLLYSVVCVIPIALNKPWKIISIKLENKNHDEIGERRMLYEHNVPKDTDTKM
jgi:hypothetical protein